MMIGWLGLLLAGVLFNAAARRDAGRSNFDRSVPALAAKQAAEDSGAAARLRQAAHSLQAAGATPVDGSEDLAQR
jgi:hypothetical protein